MSWDLNDIHFRQKLILILVWVFIALDVWILFEAWSYMPYEKFWRSECAQRVETVNSWCLVWKYDLMENESMEAQAMKWATVANLTEVENESS